MGAHNKKVIVFKEGKQIFISTPIEITKVFRVKRQNVYDALRRKHRLQGYYLKYCSILDEKDKLLKFEKLLNGFSLQISVKENSFQPKTAYYENEFDYATNKNFKITKNQLTEVERNLLYEK